MTLNEHHVTFLLYDNFPDGDGHALMFATDVHVHILATSDIWYMDGNCSMAQGYGPSHLFAVICDSSKRGGGGGGCTTCVCMCMCVYIYIYIYMCVCVLLLLLLLFFVQISYEIVTHRHGCEPSLVITDFERPVELALHSVFGPHVCIQYCFYHLTQSTWRKTEEVPRTYKHIQKGMMNSDSAVANWLHIPFSYQVK